MSQEGRAIKKARINRPKSRTPKTKFDTDLDCDADIEDFVATKGYKKEEKKLSPNEECFLWLAPLSVGAEVGAMAVLSDTPPKEKLKESKEEESESEDIEKMDKPLSEKIGKINQDLSEEVGSQWNEESGEEATEVASQVSYYSDDYDSENPPSEIYYPDKEEIMRIFDSDEEAVARSDGCEGAINNPEDINEDAVKFSAKKHEYNALDYYLDNGFFRAHPWVLQVAFENDDMELLKYICDYVREDSRISIDDNIIERAIREKKLPFFEKLVQTRKTSKDSWVAIAIEADFPEVLVKLNAGLNAENVSLAARGRCFNSLDYFYDIDYVKTYECALETAIEKSDNLLLQRLYVKAKENEELSQFITDLVTKSEDLIGILFGAFGVHEILSIVKDTPWHDKVLYLAAAPLAETDITDRELEKLYATFEDRLTISATLLPFPKESKGRPNTTIEKLRDTIRRNVRLPEEVRKAASLIGVSLSTATKYFLTSVASPLYQFHSTKSVTYTRSGNGLLAKAFPKKAKYDPKKNRPEDKVKRDPKIKEGYGLDAHLGLYRNPIDIFLDKPKEAKVITEPKTSVGNSYWYNYNLQYRRSICDYIIKEFNSEGLTIKPGFYNQYPCIMVFVKHPKDIIENCSSRMEGWAEAVISFYVAIVNYIAQTRGIAIELLRRSSFGFLTPTVAACEQSFRINVGLIPKDYAIILAKSLAILDHSLNSLYIKRGAEVDKIKESCFLNNENYPTYYKAREGEVFPKSTSLFQALWLRVETSPQRKSLIQSITRSNYAHDGLSAQVYRLLQAKPPKNADECASIFLTGLSWAVNDKLKLIQKVKSNPDKGFSLSFDDSEDIQFDHVLKQHVKIEDDGFFDMLVEMLENIQDNLASQAEVSDFVQKKEGEIIEAIKICAKGKSLEKLYFNLELLNELLFSRAIFEAESIGEVEFGSDSEGENIPSSAKKIYRKKLIVPNGMRAIWAGLHVVAEESIISKTVKKANVFLHGPYYEVEGTIRTLQKHSAFLQTPILTKGHVLFSDMNHCKTGETLLRPISPEKLAGYKALVLDSTSATTAECGVWVKTFMSHSKIESLIFVSSGFKNEQMGADKNPYGTVRIFTKNKDLLEKMYQAVRNAEQPIESPVSHSYRRLLKRMGHLPTNGEIVAASSPTPGVTPSNTLSKQGVFGARLPQFSSLSLSSAEAFIKTLKQEFQKDYRIRNDQELADAINALQKIANDSQNSEGHTHILKNSDLIQKVSEYLKESELLDNKVFSFPKLSVYVPKRGGGGGGGS